jgi:ATP-dependent Clp protease ATP-binding subunit ClpB
MRTDKLTIKAQEAIASARELAAGRGHPEIDGLHLLHALLTQGEGVVPRLAAKVGADPRRLATSVERELEALPTVQGAGLEVGVGRRFRELYEGAVKEASRFKDVYVSTEHFFLAMLHVVAGAA